MHLTCPANGVFLYVRGRFCASGQQERACRPDQTASPFGMLIQFARNSMGMAFMR